MCPLHQGLRDMGCSDCRKDRAFPSEHPVFGPDRAQAAAAAIVELEAARDMLTSWDHCFTPPAIARLAEAARVRAMYSEYSDDFRGH